MRSYAFTVISHIVGIVLSTGLLFYCVHEEIIFCPTFCGIAILYFSIHLYFIQMRQVKYWRYVVDCLRQQDLIQIVRSPYEDKVMRELADDLSAALRSLRGRLMDEEVRRQYFESLLNKVDTAVLVTDKEGLLNGRTGPPTRCWIRGVGYPMSFWRLSRRGRRWCVTENHPFRKIGRSMPLVSTCEVASVGSSA